MCFILLPALGPLERSRAGMEPRLLMQQCTLHPCCSLPSTAKNLEQRAWLLPTR